MSDILPIADAHVHFWNLEQNPYPWLMPAQPSGPFGKTAEIRRSYLLDDYRTDARHQHVVGMVHVEAGWDPDDTLGEMRWIQSVADTRGAPHAHVAHIDLAADGAAALIAAHAAFPLFRGVRDRLQDGDFTKADGTNTRIDDPDWRRGMVALDARELVFDLQAPPALAGRAAALAGTFSGVRFVLTHAGYPPAPAGDAFARWSDGIAALAERPNVAIKLSGLMLAEKAWVPEHARAVFRRLLAAFGPDRVLIASNFPVDRLFAPLDSLFGGYRDWLAELPEADQRKVLHDNTCRLYRLGE
ncbi:MAG TPA: amidohydrolase family protein [Aliidongia sp.]|uniref:amidohydrolase family protein n=1 Tax=Aliidongia sp. TaxID=1914230 RepID=UPI002DDCE1FC|nr:amidohydrolase family protein [Aliidongia sp.]HEV2676442.1 amidohydrolase family protein [Aliidongia sp.]